MEITLCTIVVTAAMVTVVMADTADTEEATRLPPTDTEEVVTDMAHTPLRTATMDTTTTDLT